MDSYYCTIYDVMMICQVSGYPDYDVFMTEQVPGPRRSKIVGRHM